MDEIPDMADEWILAHGPFIWWMAEDAPWPICSRHGEQVPHVSVDGSPWLAQFVCELMNERYRYLVTMGKNPSSDKMGEKIQGPISS